MVSCNFERVRLVLDSFLGLKALSQARLEAMASFEDLPLVKVVDLWEILEHRNEPKVLLGEKVVQLDYVVPIIILSKAVSTVPFYQAFSFST